MKATSILVLGAAFLGFCASFSTMADAADTLAQRINKLEKKTGFYERSVLKRGRHYSRRDPVDAKACDDFVGVIIPLDLKDPAELKVWMSYAVKYEIGAKPADMILSTSIGDGVHTFGGTGCENYRYDLTGNGSFKVEAYCSFAASAGDDMFVFVSFDNQPATLCAPQAIVDFSANATVNIIEMIKPK